MILAAALALGVMAPDVTLIAPDGRQIPLLARHERFAVVALGLSQKSDSNLVEQLKHLPPLDPPVDLFLLAEEESPSFYRVAGGHLSAFDIGAPRGVLVVNPAGRVVAVWPWVDVPRLARWLVDDLVEVGEDLSVVRDAVKGEEPVKSGFLLLFLSSSGAVDGLYAGRLKAAAEAASKLGIGVVALFSNAGETQESASEFAQRAGLKVRLVLDPGAAIADACRVSTTPCAVVMTKSGSVMYAGAVDSNTWERDSNIKYLMNALSDLAAGKSARISQSLPFGTSIRRE